MLFFLVFSIDDKKYLFPTHIPDQLSYLNLLKFIYVTNTELGPLHG